MALLKKWCGSEIVRPLEWPELPEGIDGRRAVRRFDWLERMYLLDSNGTCRTGLTVDMSLNGALVELDGSGPPRDASLTMHLRSCLPGAGARANVIKSRRARTGSLLVHLHFVEESESRPLLRNEMEKREAWLARVIPAER